MKNINKGFVQGTLNLTPQEVHILALIAKGMTQKEMAEICETKISTIRSHKSHLFRKLDVRIDGEAVFEGFQIGIFKNILEESK